MNSDLLDQLAERGIVALVPQQRPRVIESASVPAGRRWYSVREAADMLGFGLSKTKMLIATGELRSIKDGKYRRILPEWIDEYVSRRVEESAA